MAKKVYFWGEIHHGLTNQYWEPSSPARARWKKDMQGEEAKSERGKAKNGGERFLGQKKKP